MGRRASSRTLLPHCPHCRCRHGAAALVVQEAGLQEQQMLLVMLLMMMSWQQVRVAASYQQTASYEPVDVAVAEAEQALKIASSLRVEEVQAIAACR